jgi:membrane peptidoglycan carboxypeptidase
MEQSRFSSNLRRIAEWGISSPYPEPSSPRLELPIKLEGGSTLATQMEKYRHSPGGQTDTALSKLRQILSASLKVYRTGFETGETRRRIILEYLNTMPLSAASGFGEVHGLGAGLSAWYGLSLKDICRQLSATANDAAKARALRYVLSLLAAVRAPTYYLRHDRSALQERSDYFVRYLAKSGVIGDEFAGMLLQTPLEFAPPREHGSSIPSAERTAGQRLSPKRLDALASIVITSE